MEPRSPVDVSKQIKAVIPVEFQEEIDWFINDFSYKPPEMVGNCFRALGEFITMKLFRESEFLTEPWQIKVASIFSTLSEEEIMIHNEKVRP
jgi:hypothetical protein